MSLRRVHGASRSSEDGRAAHAVSAMTRRGGVRTERTPPRVCHGARVCRLHLITRLRWGQAHPKAVAPDASRSEAPANVADRTLDLAYGLCPVRPAGADTKAPVRSEAENLRILHQFAALVRRSRVMTLAFWSKRICRGTPPKKAKASSRPDIRAGMSCFAENLSHSRRSAPAPVSAGPGSGSKVGHFNR